MSKYIFLDNWVYSRLTDAENERRLSAFINHKGYTILISTLSFVELYNPNWEKAGEKDRMNKTVHFLSKHPSVIISPEKVWQAEIKSYPNQVSFLPIELDLQNISSESRASKLLSILKSETMKEWVRDYAQTKMIWFSNVDKIIENACINGDLLKDKKGIFIELEKHKEIFLLSLDLRTVEPSEIDSLLKKLGEAKKKEQLKLTAVRLSSLCFWYSYINIDQSNKMKRNGSDIGDFYNISLLPYCSAFTTDGSMYGMLKRIVEPIVPTGCEVITPYKLDKILSRY
jgi:hypothetical protein